MFQLLWKLINKFLFFRKVRLIHNDQSGIIRACREFGLPQDSALPPILFKFFIRDLAQNVVDGQVIKRFKFADDGTLKITRGVTTAECLDNFMKTNCNSSKTELICLGTAEGNPDLIPETVKLRNYRLRFVEKTKVLGLVMEQKLSYIGTRERKSAGRYCFAGHQYVNIPTGTGDFVITKLYDLLKL